MLKTVSVTSLLSHSVLYRHVLRKSHYATYHRNTRGSGMYGDFSRIERGRENSRCFSRRWKWRIMSLVDSWRNNGKVWHVRANMKITNWAIMETLGSDAFARTVDEIASEHVARSKGAQFSKRTLKRTRTRSKSIESSVKLMYASNEACYSVQPSRLHRWPSRLWRKHRSCLVSYFSE